MSLSRRLDGGSWVFVSSGDSGDFAGAMLGEGLNVESRFVGLSHDIMIVGMHWGGGAEATVIPLRHCCRCLQLSFSVLCYGALCNTDGGDWYPAREKTSSQGCNIYGFAPRGIAWSPHLCVPAQARVHASMCVPGGAADRRF